MISKALVDFGLTNVNAEKYSLVEVLFLSIIFNFTDRILESNEYPLHVLQQQRKVNYTKKEFISSKFCLFS